MEEAVTIRAEIMISCRKSSAQKIDKTDKGTKEE
jgi:hypothetical protein